MPILLAIIILTILEFWRSIKVIRGQFRVIINHMILNSKKFVTCDILRCSAFFLIYSMHMLKLRSSEVNEYCNIAVFSFHLRRSKTQTYDPRSNEAMDTKKDDRFGKYGS